MNQKLEVQFRLALETLETERVHTENLSVGYNAMTREWELIVKYHGTLEKMKELGIRVEELIAGFAILTVPENLVETMADFPEIEYIEKPKRYFETQTGPASASCIAQVIAREPFLSGQGVLIAILDSGIAYERAEFRKGDGSTRILSLWDQTLKDGTPPQGFLSGVEFTKEQIDRELLRSPEVPMEGNLAENLWGNPVSMDITGHGTAVAGIAAGYSDGYQGVAPEADLLIVKLGKSGDGGFMGTTQIMRGVTYALRKASEYAMPLVINLSFGNSYGPHDGSSLLECFLDAAAGMGRTVICVGSGNEGNSDGHILGNVLTDPQVELAVTAYQRSLSIQIWKHYADNYRITFRAPDGSSQMLSTNISGGKYTFYLDRTKILLYMGEPSPYSVDQEIYLELIPQSGDYLTEGVYQILFEPLSVVTGAYSIYLPSSSVRNVGTGFFRPTVFGTITNPATASRVITVGAYNSLFDSYADFSGRGYEGKKPDLVAPGVDVLAPFKEEGFTAVTGTSFATPIVSGAAALLMEWGIVRGKDPYLYGEKMKAYLQKGALPLRGIVSYPDHRVGWGKLCVSGSLPKSFPFSG